MESEVISEPTIEDILPEMKTRGLNIAKIISNVLSPPTMVALALMVIGITVPDAWRWMGFYILEVVVIPVAFLLYQLRVGQVSSFNVPVREERYKLLVLVVIMTLVGWVTMWQGGAPYEVVLLSGIGILIVSMLLVISLFWKISVHATAMSGFCMFMVSYLGWENWPILFAIPIMAWARIRSDSHSFWQTIAGSFTGAGFIFTVVTIIAWQCNGTGMACG